RPFRPNTRHAAQARPPTARCSPGSSPKSKQFADGLPIIRPPWRQGNPMTTRKKNPAALQLVRELIRHEAYGKPLSDELRLGVGLGRESILDALHFSIYWLIEAIKRNELVHAEIAAADAAFEKAERERRGEGNDDPQG